MVAISIVQHGQHDEGRRGGGGHGRAIEDEDDRVRVVTEIETFQVSTGFNIFDLFTVSARVRKSKPIYVSKALLSKVVAVPNSTVQPIVTNPV